ncbi:MAG: phosphatidate cytidylyltransferase [bacterium]
MKTRIILSLILVPAFAFFIFFPPSAPFIGLVLLLGMLSVNEVYGMIDKKNMPSYKLSGIIFTFLILLFSIKPNYIANPVAFVLLAFAVFIIFLLTKVILSKDINNFPKVLNTLFPVIYIAVLGSFTIQLRLMENGYYLIFLLFLYTLVYDGGAYFAGSFFGKHKLIPEISPGKSIEGCVGGVIINIITVVIIKYTFLPVDIFGHNTLLHLIIMAIILSITGQAGDLAASVIKRFCGVKNSSNLLPEMGGILDKIDSTLFNAPVLFLYITYIVKLF